MRLFSFVLVLLFLQSCSSGEDKTTPATTPTISQAPAAPATYDNTLATGKVITVVCKSDTTQTYSLYLPSNYTSSKSWPVFFAFDPHAKGSEATKYSALAEKYGYIIAGSNNSRNNQEADVSAKVIKTLMGDVTSRVNIDNARIYAMGFSGGAKVASGIAISNGGITGVIGCGAGFPDQVRSITNRFYYFGIVGDGDFNYGSLIALNESLQNNNMPHQLRVFEGKHEWPPAEYIDEAFLYMALNAMRDTKAPKNDSLVQSALPKYTEKEKQYEKDGDLYNAWIEDQRIIAFFDQLADISHYRESLGKLANTPQVKKGIEEKTQMLAKESKLQQDYVNDLKDKGLQWWMGEIDRLRKAAKTEKDRQQAGLDKRLVAFFGILSYTSANRALGQNNLDAAAQFVQILNAVDPKNQDVPYLNACILAKQGQPEKALAELKRAVALGYDDKGKMNTEPALEAVRKLPGYKSLYH